MTDRHLKCTPEMAEKIVELLIADPSTAGVFKGQGKRKLVPWLARQTCMVCGDFVPAARTNLARKTCSTECAKKTRRSKA